MAPQPPVRWLLMCMPRLVLPKRCRRSRGDSVAEEAPHNTATLPLCSAGRPSFDSGHSSEEQECWQKGSHHVHLRGSSSTTRASNPATTLPALQKLPARRRSLRCDGGELLLRPRRQEDVAPPLARGREAPNMLGEWIPLQNHRDNRERNQGSRVANHGPLGGLHSCGLWHLHHANDAWHDAGCLFSWLSAKSHRG
jgi:hypothetical protein